MDRQTADVNSNYVTREIMFRAFPHSHDLTLIMGGYLPVDHRNDQLLHLKAKPETKPKLQKYYLNHVFLTLVFMV